jgi:hypothetical protein
LSEFESRMSDYKANMSEYEVSIYFLEVKKKGFASDQSESVDFASALIEKKLELCIGSAPYV